MLTRRTLLKASAACSLMAGGQPVAAARGTAAVNFARLSNGFAGTVILPSSPAYAAARMGFTHCSRFDHYPAAIARCANPADVARAVAFARESGLKLAVRSGGHDVLAASSPDGALVVDLGGMDAIAIAPGLGSVRVGPGVRAGALVSALGPSGHAAVLGTYTGVGVGGLVTGGGLGMLMASRGASCDNLLRADLITAEGRPVSASADENPDLFWAIKGGGGNFGIITGLDLAIHHIPQVVSGPIVLDGADLPGWLRFFGGFMASAPRELVVESRYLWTDRPTILLQVMWVGDPGLADAALAPLRAAAPVLADAVSARRYAEWDRPTPAIGAIFGRSDPAIPQWDRAPNFVWRGGSIRRVDDSAIAAICEHVALAPKDIGWGFDLGHHMHGAVCDVTPEQSPLPRPAGTFTFHIDAWWARRSDTARAMAWLDAFWDAMTPHAAPAYVNYLSTDAPSAIAAAYGPAFDRLRQIKRKYDPDNLFRSNRNIPPAP